MASKETGMGELRLPERGARRKRDRSGKGVPSAWSESKQQEPGEAVEVPLDDIADHPSNEPDRVDEDKLEELVASVRQVGVLEPALLVPADKFLEHHPEMRDAVGSAPWVSLTGHRRRAAARAVGLTTVPAIVREDLADHAGDEVPLHENNGQARLGLTPLQEARRFADAMEQRQLSQLKLAQHLGRPQGQISKRLALLTLPPKMQELIDAEVVTVLDAGKVASALKNSDSPKLLANEIDAVLNETVGEKVSAATALKVAEQRVQVKRVEAATTQLAKDEGLDVVRPDKVSDVQLLTDTQEIEEAKARGDLAVTTGPDGPVYVRTSEPDLTPQQLQQRQEQQAHAARTAYLSGLIGRLTTEEQTAVLTRAVITGLDLVAATKDARELCRKAGIGQGVNAVMDAQTWRLQVSRADTGVATAIALTAIEAAATADSTSDLAQWYRPWLASHGYTLTDYERDNGYSTE